MEDTVSKPECCQDEDNLEPASGSMSSDTVMVKMVCQECDRAHYIAAARAKRFGIQGADA